MKRESTRINIQVPNELLELVDVAARSLNLSRSAWVCMAVSRQLQSESLINALPEFISLIKAEQSKQLLQDSSEQE